MSKLRAFARAALLTPTDECVLWPFSVSGARVKYGKLLVAGREVPAHRYVCEAAHGAPPTLAHQAAHQCGVSLCVNPRHIRWLTRTENEADKLHHGTTNRGSRNGRSKLTETDVLDIRNLHAMWQPTQQEIAVAWGVSRRIVGMIVRRTHWRHI